jgi:predicted flap endonuclease-1-like 5' DNA nuclease
MGLFVERVARPGALEKAVVQLIQAQPGDANNPDKVKDAMATVSTALEDTDFVYRWTAIIVGIAIGAVLLGVGIFLAWLSDNWTADQALRAATTNGYVAPTSSLRGIGTSVIALGSAWSGGLVAAVLTSPPGTSVQAKTGGASGTGSPVVSAAPTTVPDQGASPTTPTAATGDTAIKIEDVEGIGPAYVEKLVKAGVKTTDDLLARGARPKGRDELEKATGISHAKILGWVNRVDLYRLDGVGSEYSDLLEEAGVDSPAELAHRFAGNLAAKLEEINKAKKLVRRVPTEKVVAGWIEQAKKLPKVVEH